MSTSTLFNLSHKNQEINNRLVVDKTPGEIDLFKIDGSGELLVQVMYNIFRHTDEQFKPKCKEIIKDIFKKDFSSLDTQIMNHKGAVGIIGYSLECMSCQELLEDCDMGKHIAKGDELGVKYGKITLVAAFKQLVKKSSTEDIKYFLSQFKDQTYKSDCAILICEELAIKSPDSKFSKALLNDSELLESVFKGILVSQELVEQIKNDELKGKITALSSQSRDLEMHPEREAKEPIQHDFRGFLEDVNIFEVNLNEAYDYRKYQFGDLTRNLLKFVTFTGSISDVVSATRGALTSAASKFYGTVSWVFGAGEPQAHEKDSGQKR